MCADSASAGLTVILLTSLVVPRGQLIAFRRVAIHRAAIEGKTQSHEKQT